MRTVVGYTVTISGRFWQGKLRLFLSESCVSEDRTCRHLYQIELVLESSLVDHMLVLRNYMSEFTYP